MAKLWSATSLVALALLGCLVGTEVEAQDSTWPKPATPMSKGSLPPQAPQTYQPPQHRPAQAPTYPAGPQVQRRPAQTPSYPAGPQVQHRPAQAPTYPAGPQVQHRPAQAPTYPAGPQVQHRPAQAPTYPEKPQVQHRPAQAPTYPERPQVQFRPQQDYQPLQKPQVGRPQQTPHYLQKPGQHPSPPQTPNYPQKPGQHPSPPQTPNYPQKPGQHPSPPQTPNYPQKPGQHPSPPQFPKHSQTPKLPPRMPPKSPQHQQTPKFSPFPRAFPDSQYPKDPQVIQPQQYSHDTDQPSALSIQQASVPKDPSFETCQVADSQKIPCGSSTISPAECESINCCFDGRKCYFAKAVTVQCTKDAHFIVVVARDASLPNINLESISLLGRGEGCTHVDYNSGFAIYYFPVTACGTVVREVPGFIIYENMMSSVYEIEDGPTGRITRDSKYELSFQCKYSGTSVEGVVIQLLADEPLVPVAALGPVRVQLRLANGYCHSKGCNEVDAAYSSFYTEADYPVTKVLRDPVYVEVQLLERTDPFAVLILDHCWTTTTQNPHSLPQWDILVDGCPSTDDLYRSTLVPIGPSSGLEFPMHYKRFIFQMFTFVDLNSYQPLNEQVYIHCSTHICLAMPGGVCGKSCSRKKREIKAADTKKAEPMVVVSAGPVIMTAPGE